MAIYLAIKIKARLAVWAGNELRRNDVKKKQNKTISVLAIRIQAS